MDPKNLKIYMFNVGTGDHLMIEFPDSSIGIIDSFFSDKRLKLQEPPAVTFLKYKIDKKKIEGDVEKIKIAFLCLSHADHDHIKSINVLFKLLDDNAEHIELENLWLFGGIDFDLYKEEVDKLNTEFSKLLSEDAQEEFSKSANRFKNELTAIQEFKKKWTSSGATESYFNDFKEFNKYNPDRLFRAYSIGPIARIINDQQNTSISKLIANVYERIQLFQNEMVSDENVEIKLRFNRNSISAILGIHVLGRGLLFLGDATSHTIEASLNDIPKKNKEAINLLFNPSFVKVGHHGAKGSTTHEIWDKLFTNKTDKTIFGVSAGQHKKNKHPHTELFEHLNVCCKKKCINHIIYRTNECKDCDNKKEVQGEIDLDFWFQFHGCKFDDRRLPDALKYDAPKTEHLTVKPKEKNLLAYIFEISNDDLKVYRGVSGLIGNYSECVFEQKIECYC